MASATRAADIVPDTGVAVGLTVDRARASFARSLRAANKAPRTVQTYLDALEVFDRFLAKRGMPPHVGTIRREHVEAFLVELQDAGRGPASVANDLHAWPAGLRFGLLCRRGGPEHLPFAARYAASTAGHGMDRVGLATSGSMGALTWEEAATRIRRLGRRRDS